MGREEYGRKNGEFMEIILIVLFGALAAVAAVLYFSERSTSRRVSVELRAVREEALRAGAACSAAERELADVRVETERRLAAVQAEAERRLAEAQAEIRVQSERVEMQTVEREKLQRQLTDHFRNLANDILEEKTRRFTDTNRKNIGELLKPLGEHIERFRQRIEQDARERDALEKEVRRLHEMSNQVSREANNLAAALRGNSKTQGDWGEIILETLLESSGLQRGIHFRVQEDFRTEEGTHVRPDVVLLLPDNKQMVIDSKVSLTAYAQYVDAEDASDEGGRKAALAAHVASVRRHIDELAAKSYQKLTTASPDFVIMFVPNEPAFLVALQSDAKLWDEAYRRKVILSSPTNLFAILKIVDDLWRRDNQDRYALEIAEKGGALYDKFVGFAESFLAVGESLGRTDKAYKKALGQLREGNGNLIRRTEELRKLGVKAAKKMPAALTPLDDEGAPESVSGEASALPEGVSAGEAEQVDSPEQID